MKILGINGSPRKLGSTYELMSWVLEGATASGAEMELIHLADYNIGYCQGCNRCLIEKSCVLQDDLKVVYEKLMSADGIVLGSPVYEGSESAQMKTLMDRVALLSLYAGIFEGKITVGVSTSGVAPTKKTAVTIADMFGARIGWIGSKTAKLDSGFVPLSKDSNPKAYKRAFALGRKLVSKIESSDGLRLITLQSKWIYFLRKHLLKKMVLKNWKQFSGAIEMRPDIYK